jgi:PAS domain S-box-containing protein
LGLRAISDRKSLVASRSQDGQVQFGQMQALWEDGERVFHRASRDEPAGDRPNVIVVVLAGENPTTASVDRLAHEYSLKDHLDAPWAVRPLDLVRERGRTMLVLEDHGAEPLDRLLGSPLELPAFLRLAEALTAALRGLHERGLIHKDINPANVLVNDATGEVWLTGFGVASRLPRERQAPSPPEFIAGTLPYIAPEQTGRMNRSIDSRSDLYSLGITFYQMLTGSLPFTAHDPMEWVHCHIARTPVPPHERFGNIPALISQIVMKLVAKTAEERYQTAAGVEHDLRQCRAEWEMRGGIDDFPLAAHDVPARLLIPEKLYGRSREVAALLSSFRRVVATGAPELVLVSGYSGIGKSSVVNELHKVLVPPRGLFASGKFDQYKSDIPYATVAQAFQSLVRQILSKSEAELQGWRDALREALGPNGLLIVNLIPELELVIGEQPPVPDLLPQDAQRRFQTALRRFIAVFARPEHPLALFLDDLQWLDAATLDLLEDLLARRDIRHLLLIGAYRDNEVDAAHPLMRKLDAIRRAGASVEDIVLAPLTYDDLEQLISESLRCETKPASPLVQLVHEKTGGNPFFANQFLSALADEALLVFDHADGRWLCDLARVHAKRYTDNVVDLMVVKLNRLPAETQAPLRQLACVGSSAEFSLLGTACQTSEEKLHESLWEAVRSGLVHRSENGYAFQHDRVQEAAYSLIPEEARAEAHLRIGRLLVAHTPSGKLEEAIFEIVNQLNRASSLVTAPEEREQLAKFNLLAGERAQASSAHVSALNYLTTGAALLTEDSWLQHHELSFALELARANCEFASGMIAESEKRLRSLYMRAATTGERVAVASLQVDLYLGIDRGNEAIAVGLRALRHLGVDFPERPTEADARRAYDGIWTRLGGRTIEDLIDLPLMSDPDSLAAVDLLIRIAVPGYFNSFHLGAVAVYTAVSLGLERGHSEASCIAYAQLGIYAGPHFGQFDAGYRFGRLGCELAERPGLQRFQARTYRTFGFVVPWTRHVRKGREFLLRGIDLSSRLGEITYAGNACAHLTTNYLAAGDALIETQEQAEHGLALARKVGFGALEVWITGQLGLIRSLRGLTIRLGCFDDDMFREGDLERELAGNPASALTECWYYIRKLQARFLAGEYADALQASSMAQPMLSSTVSLLEVVEYHFYDALCHAAVAESASSEDREYHFARLTGHLEKLDTWATHCPENFANRAALVGAELARLEGRGPDAERLYEQAIRSARANGFVHNEALAYEVAARFYAARGLENIAELFLARARDGYRRWGADGKVRQLEARYPQLALTDTRGGTQERTSPDLQLDVAAVVKASQALSSEILLPHLIERLMTIALQHAGADRGLLIVPYQNGYRIEAEARMGGEGIALHYGAPAGVSAPKTIIRYVMRTHESVILDDAAKQNLFSEDPYFGLRQPRSILCLPLIRQGTLGGLLYLENTLASHVFTPDRERLLKLLASQAAISLENTRLYGDLQDREARVRRLIDSNIVGIVIWGLEGEIIDANDAFLKIVGYDRNDLATGTMRWTELTPPNWRRAADERVEDLKAGGSFQAYEKEYFRRDGSRVPVLVGGATFSEAGDQGFAIVVDLTDRKQAEQAARESERRYHEVQMELAHVNRVATIGQLSASIAHEVNQPLSGIVTNASTLARMLTADPPNVAGASETARRMIRDANRAADIITRLRALFAKKEASNDLVNLNEASNEIISLSQREFQSGGVVVRSEFADNLPPVKGDRVQLQQVLLNLVRNGLDAMSSVDNRQRELIITTAEAEPDNISVAVQDSGPGVDPANLERIFEAFYTTKPDGLGIGLSICRNIIEAHGGKLWATTAAPQGTILQFTLPAAPV